MGPAGFTVLVAFYVRGEALMGKLQICHAIVLIKIKNQFGVGPFLLVRIPGHITIRNQPNYPFAGLHFGYGEIEERIATHLYRKGVVLLFGVSAKGYAPPPRHIADPFDRLVGGNPGRNTAVKIVTSHLVCF